MATTLETIAQRFQATVLKTRHILPIEANKGRVGWKLEELLGIPHTSNCLDCSDGELKATEFVRRGGALTPKETLAITMVDRAALLATPFEESRVYKKLKNMLLVVYEREADGTVVFQSSHRFGESHPLFAAVAADYRLIQSEALEGRLTGSIGTYLQTRTKGPGHGSTSRAFYLRTRFLKELVSGQN